MGWGGLCVGGYARLATNLVLHSAGARISLLPTAQSDDMLLTKQQQLICKLIHTQCMWWAYKSGMGGGAQLLKYTIKKDGVGWLDSCMDTVKSQLGPFPTPRFLAPTTCRVCVT